jgi:hypothetical protein
MRYTEKVKELKRYMDMLQEMLDLKEKELMEIDEGYREPQQLIVCADGFTMSVQANEGTYCSPRMNDSRYYTRVEVGFPSEPEELLIPWIEGYDDTDPTETVYPYTPAKVIMDVIVKHGGMVSGELPPLKIEDKGEEE